LRPRRGPGRGQGAGRLPRGAGVPEGAMTRADRLRASLEEPLLVTAPANIVYLTGFESSNAALLVEPERVRLFTDFRYADAARAVPGVEAVETKRSLFTSLAELLEGRIAFEADAVTYAAYRTLADAGIDLVPRRGIVEAGQLVVVDWGATVGGYSSDCTRTVATGELPDQLARSYEACLEAQLAAVAGVRAGLGGVEADGIARQRIAAAGFGEAFGHG